jgi:uncharacterized protein (TIGR04141 family)
MPDDSVNRVTVYRLKITNFEQLDLANYIEVFSNTFRLENTDYPYLLYFLPQCRPKEASWFRLFSSLPLNLDRNQIPKVLFSGFILIVKVADSFYGLCGGLGHTVLTKQPIEHRFGIVLAQKILSIPELKGLVQKDTSGEVYALNRVFRATYNPYGDLSNLKRVLTHIRGKLDSKNQFCESIGKSIKAGDSLSVTGKKSFKDIIIFLKMVEELWQSDRTGLSIPQLEYIDKKFEAGLLEQLEKTLVNIIRGNSNEVINSLFLDNPDIGYLPDRTEKYILICNRIRYEAETCDGVFRHISDIFNGLSNEEMVIMLHKMRVKVIFDNDQFETYPLYKLICGDIYYQNNIYFLNNGLWYRASEEFVSSLNQEIDNVPFVEPESLLLNEWGNGGEDVYNNNHTALSVLHKKLIHITGEKGPIEFCDLMKVDSDGLVWLIHVKPGSGAKLRALFAQGYVSARLYSDSNEFRDKVHRAELSGNITSPDKQKLAALETRLKRNFTIVFAIYDNTASHKVGSNARTTTEYLKGTLTAFAKVDLLGRVVDLRRMAYNVALTRIKPYP